MEGKGEREGFWGGPRADAGADGLSTQRTDSGATTPGANDDDAPSQTIATPQHPHRHGAAAGKHSNIKIGTAISETSLSLSLS